MAKPKVPLEHGLLLPIAETKQGSHMIEDRELPAELVEKLRPAKERLRGEMQERPIRLHAATDGGAKGKGWCQKAATGIAVADPTPQVEEDDEENDEKEKMTEDCHGR